MISGIFIYAGHASMMNNIDAGELLDYVIAH